VYQCLAGFGPWLKLLAKVLQGDDACLEFLLASNVIGVKVPQILGELVVLFMPLLDGRPLLGLGGLGPLGILGSTRWFSPPRRNRIVLVGRNLGRRWVTVVIHDWKDKVMNTLHVVTEVPTPGKAFAWDGTFTVLEVAGVGPISVAVHSVSLSLVTKQAGGRRKAHTTAGFAVVRLEVRVQVFAKSTWLET
jgi:hypothetical protein